MIYQVSYEVSHPEDENITGVLPVEASSSKRAVEFAQHALEEKYPGEEDYVLLECQVQPGRPIELQGDYELVSVKIRKDLLDKIKQSGKSRRQYIEELLEQ